jgi:outer membrane protein assembly factor BamA
MRLACLLFLLISFTLCSQNADIQSLQTETSQKKDSIVTIGTISLSGNKITKDQIILREIEFTPGEILTDSALTSLILKSRQNLLNRSLFNFVTITQKNEDAKANIEVVVVERWYIWPIPIINTAGRNLNAWWESKDFGRLNYGVDLRVDNFRGRMEKLNFIIQGGFDQMLAAKWTIPYLTEKQFLGVGIGGGYQRNREIIVATANNKPVFYESPDGYAQERGFALVDLTLRPKFNFLHTFTLGFDHYSFQDTLQELNPNYAFGLMKYNFFSLSYQYKQDFRDYKPYPLKGYYFDAGVAKQGIGIFSDSVNTWSLSAVFEQYNTI